MEKTKIIIVGAGIAGMTAAKTLRETNLFEVSVLEASSSAGGRVASTKVFKNVRLDLGAEFCHGEDAAYMKLVEKQAKLQSEEELTDYISFKGQIFTADQFSKENPEFDSIFDISDASLNSLPKNTNFKQYLQNKGITSEIQKLAFSFYCNENATDEDTLTARAVATIEQNWSSGSIDFVLPDQTQSYCFESIFKEEMENIEFNKIVRSIEYSGEKVEISCEDGSKQQCDCVLVSVPLSQLKKGSIEFIPELPLNLRESIEKLQFGKVGKLFFKLKNPLPLDNLSSLHFDSELSCLWKPLERENIYLCFISGKYCDEFEKEKESLKAKILGLLSKSIPKIDFEEELLEINWFNWDKVPFIEGAYSIPVEEDQDRIRSRFDTLIEGKLGFIGEAFSEDQHSSMNGAYLTGLCMAEKVIQQYK